MKSYFAKLAARATLANAPASSLVNQKKVADPFEDPSLSETAPPSSETAVSLRSSDQTSNPRLDQPSAAEPQRLPARSESAEAVQTARPPMLISKSTPDVRAGEPVTEALEPHELAATDESPPARAVKRQVFEADVSPAKASLAPPVEASPPRSPERTSDQTTEENPVEISQLEERLAEIDDDQALLQRKADLFMQGVLERREQLANEPEIQAGREDQNTLKPENKLEKPVALQPGKRGAQVPEHKSDRPSLVIGNLTVEVMPAAPQPVAPPQQVVIVRSGRSGGTIAPSSRRFGLGQF